MKDATDRQNLTCITVSVQYHDLLSLTMPSRQKWCQRIVVVTSSEDRQTQKLCRDFQVECLVTDCFYYYGAIFNKGLAIEKAFHHTGRQGWYLVLDADIVLDRFPDITTLDDQKLYSCRRRQLNDPRQIAQWPPDKWRHLPYVTDGELPGCFHLFSSAAQVCRQIPWYGIKWKHAAGCDSEFERKWPKENKVWLPMDILHLGPHGTNWCGRVMEMLDGSLPRGAAEAETQMRNLRTQRNVSLKRYQGEWIEQPIDMEWD